MTVADLALLALIGISALLGLMRGFVGVVASMAAWILAGWAAFHFGAKAAYWSSGGAAPDATDLLAGYGISFFGVLVMVWLLSWILREMVRSSGLSGLDRSMGMAVGFVRGGFLACVVVLLMGYTDLPKQPAWRQSRVVPVLMPGVQVLQAMMPDAAVDVLDFGTRRLPAMAKDAVGKEPFSLQSLGSLGGISDPGKLMSQNGMRLPEGGKELLAGMQGQEGQMNLLKEVLAALPAPAKANGNGGVLNMPVPSGAPQPQVDPADISAASRSQASPSSRSDDAFVH